MRLCVLVHRHYIVNQSINQLHVLLARGSATIGYVTTCVRSAAYSSHTCLRITDPNRLRCRGKRLVAMAAMAFVQVFLDDVHQRLLAAPEAFKGML